MEYCGAKSRQTGKPCKKPAGWGVPGQNGIGRCKLHLGGTPSHKTAAQREQARQACELFNLALEHREPPDVLYDEVLRARGAMAWFEREIALAMEAGDDELRGRRYTGWLIERKIAQSVSVEIQRLGLEERRQQVNEQFARIVMAVLEKQCELLGIDPSSPEARSASRAALQLVAGSG